MAGGLAFSGKDAAACSADVDPTLSSPVTVMVHGLSGPRCTVEAFQEWSISQVQQAISEKLDIPQDWQTLILGSTQLRTEVTLGSLINVELDTELQLTLLVKEDPQALLAAVQRGDQPAALRLLRQAELPGLNRRADRYGRTVLHKAINWELPDVALAILARPDFSCIDAKGRWSWTALHCAADQGLLPICHAILERADFRQLLAQGLHGETASQVARQRGHEAVTEFLESAEVVHFAAHS